MQFAAQRLNRLRPMTALFLAALIAGLTSSGHCAVMCGPLAGLAGRPLEWHLGRLSAYSFIGLALGAVGATVTHFLRGLEAWLPWVMALGLVMTAFEVGRGAGGTGWLSSALTRASRTVDVSTRALLLGAATAVLPCGLLYGMFITAMASGTPWSGAGVMFAFALGAIPALLGAQSGLRWLSKFPRLSRWVRMGVPLVAAALIVARALSTRADPAICH